MITAAYGLTATERVLPSFVLDWTTGLSQDAVGVARTGVATFVGSNGLIQSAVENTQRVDYSTGIAGILVEESRTNLSLKSNGFDDSAVWIPSNISVTTAPVASPNGLADAYALTSADNGFIQQNHSFSGSDTYAFSAYVRKSNFSTCALVIRGASFSNKVVAVFNFDFLTISISVNGNFTNGSSSFIDAGNGWYRVTVIGTTDASETSVQTRILVNTATVGAEIYAWGAQLEEGTFPTSYIPTTSAAVTRNADVATVTGTNFSDFFNAAEGTFIAEFIYSGLVNAGYVLTASEGDTLNASISFTSLISSNRFQLRVSDGAGATVGAANYTSLGVPEANRLYRAAMKYKTDDYGLAMDGNAVVADTAGTYSGTADNLKIGASYNSAGTQLLNGHFQKLLYYPQALTNAELQAFSKQG